MAIAKFGTFDSILNIERKTARKYNKWKDMTMEGISKTVEEK